MVGFELLVGLGVMEVAKKHNLNIEEDVGKFFFFRMKERKR